MIYFKLFFVFAKLGIFTYGGGYAIIAVLLDLLKSYNWMTSSEFSNLLAISQITPGPIAVNTATFVGYKVAGVLGSFVATLGITVPAFFIAMFSSKFFYKLKTDERFISIINALRVSAIVFIFSTIIIFSKDILTVSDFFNKNNIISISIILLSFILKIIKIPIIIILFISGVLGILLY